MATPQRIYTPFGEFKPDLKDFAHDSLQICSGWAPVHGSYVGAPTWELLGTGFSALGNTHAYGLHAHDLGAGAWMAYMGDVTKLYKIDPASAYARTDISRTVGGAYATTGSGGQNGWQFTSFGRDVIATNYVDDPQLLISGAANFVKLAQSGGANPGMDPKAKFVFPIRNNLFLANCNLSAPFDTLAAGANPTLVAWCQSDNVRQYGSVTVTPQLVGAGYQPIENDFGHLTGGVGCGDFGLAFQSSAITLIEGPPYQFRTLVRHVGTRFPNSIALVDTDVYFWSAAGPAVLRNGQVVQLGNGRVTRSLIDNASGFSGDAINSSIDVKYVSAGVDAANSLVIWAITPNDRSPAVEGLLLVYYNYAEDRFSFVDTFVNDGDELSVGGLLYMTNRPPTSEAWLPHRDVVAIALAPIVGGQEFFTLPSNALPAPATIARAFQQFNPDVSQRIRRVRPVYSTSDNGSLTITATVETKNQAWEAPAVTGPFTGMDTHGWITTPSSVFGDFHRVTFAFTAGASSLQELKGFEVEIELGGRYAR